MDEVTKILHLHTRIGYIQKWVGTSDMAPPGNYQIITLVTYIYSEP